MESPYTVRAPGGKTRLLVMDAREGLPAAFALMGTQAQHRVALRISGGCKGMTLEDKRAMLDYFRHAFVGCFAGVAWSGATLQVTPDGALDPMVTDVPGVIAEGNPGCIALGTCPRTALLSLQGESRLVLDDYGTAPNPTMQGILIVQNGADGTLDWDGDLDAYFALMEQWRDHAAFTALGLIAWNGGAVTEREIMRAAAKGWPTIVIKGSGRVADDIAAKLERDDPALRDALPRGHLLRIAHREDPNSLRELLSIHGFIR